MFWVVATGGRYFTLTLALSLRERGFLPTLVSPEGEGAYRVQYVHEREVTRCAGNEQRTPREQPQRRAASAMRYMEEASTLGTCISLVGRGVTPILAFPHQGGREFPRHRQRRLNWYSIRACGQLAIWLGYIYNGDTHQVCEEARSATPVSRESR